MENTILSNRWEETLDSFNGAVLDPERIGSR